MRKVTVKILLAAAISLMASSCSGAESSTSPDETTTSTSAEAIVTTTTKATTTTTIATTTTAASLTWEAPECTVLQATMWFASDHADVSAFEESLMAGTDLYAALLGIGAPADELFDQRGTVGISNWLLEQVQDTSLYENGEWDGRTVVMCAAVPESEGIKTTVDFTEDSIEGFAQVFAGRYGLPGEAGVLGSRENPVVFGETATVGDWEVRVVDVTPDGTSAVLDENRFNDPPAEGNVFLIATLEATYLGTESAEFWLDMSWSAIGPSNVAYDQYDASCGVIPDPIRDEGEAFRDGSISGNVCWEVPSVDASAEDLSMILEGSFGSGDRTFFSLVPSLSS
jgi:hypothetical protein